MRMYRILTAVIAFAMFGLAPLAGAANASGVSADRASAPTAHRHPHRHLHDKVVKVGAHTLIYKGRVDPAHGPVIIEKKNCRKGCPWHKVDSAKTDADSRW
jgi:hypothetical protein